MLSYLLIHARISRSPAGRGWRELTFLARAAHAEEKRFCPCELLPKCYSGQIKD